MLYIIGSLSNPNIITVAKALKAAGIETFSEWMSSGPEADQHWKAYGKAMGWSYRETLQSAFVQTAFNFDYSHMQKADGCVLVMPAGKSAHTEFGWFTGQGKRAYILFEGEPDRPDLMPSNLATEYCFSVEELIDAVKPSSSVIREVSNQDSGIHVNIPQLGISCGCVGCVRGRGHIGGSGAAMSDNPNSIDLSRINRGTWL